MILYVSVIYTPFLFLPDEAGYVDVCEGGHQVLTVEPVHDAAVSGDGVGEVLKERRDEVCHDIRTQVPGKFWMNVSFIWLSGHENIKMCPSWDCSPYLPPSPQSVCLATLPTVK